MLIADETTPAGSPDLSALFSQDLTAVDISRPVLRAGTYAFAVESCEVKPQKPPKTGSNLVIQLALAVTAQSVKNEVVNPGFRLTTQIALTPTEKYTSQRIQEELKKFQVACGRGGAFGDPAAYKGARCLARLTVRDADDFGDMRNEVKGFNAEQ